MSAPANLLAVADGGTVPMEAWNYLNALNDAILVVDRDRQVRFANMAAEQFFEVSLGYLQRSGLDQILSQDSQVMALIEQVLATGVAVAEYGVTIETPRVGAQFVNIQAAPVQDGPAGVIVAIHRQSIARKIDHQLTHRNAARSVTAMASMLSTSICSCADSCNCRSCPSRAAAT